MSEIIQLDFLVQGSSPEPYTVSFERDGNNVTSTCTCIAGHFKSVCKHRLAVIEGDYRNVVGGQENMPLISELLIGTDVGEAYNTLQECLEAQKTVEWLRALPTPAQRTDITEDVVTAILAGGGVAAIKEQNKTAACYNTAGEYLGSAKVGYSCLKSCVQHWDIRARRSYLALKGSIFILCFDMAGREAEARRRLRQAFRD